MLPVQGCPWCPPSTARCLTLLIISPHMFPNNSNLGPMITPSLLPHTDPIIVTSINISDVTLCHTSHYCDQSVTGPVPQVTQVCVTILSLVIITARMRSRPHIWAVIPMVQLPGYQVR